MLINQTILNELTLILSAVFSALALMVSISGVYLQFIRVKGPRIECLSPSYEQRARALPFELLPEQIREAFPNLPEPNPNYFIIDLAFANSGDRTGFVWIQGVEGQVQESNIKTSFYDYGIIPPGSVTLQRILVRNIPQIESTQSFSLVIKGAWGGIRRGQYKESERFPPYRVPISLLPSNG